MRALEGGFGLGLVAHGDVDQHVVGIKIGPHRRRALLHRIDDADGSGLRRLTRNNVADWEPDWSPDGQKIAWLSRGTDGTGADIFVMNADGSDQQNLTPKPGNRGEPRWSPDGRSILFTAVPPGQPHTPPRLPRGRTATTST